MKKYLRKENEPLLRGCILFLFAALVAPEAGFCAAGKFTAAVESVIDGDTIGVVMADGSKKRIRLAGVDCPELKYHDPCAVEAKEFTKTHTLGKSVTIYPRTVDKYKRMVAFVIYLDDSGAHSLGLELVRAGLARMYTNNFRVEGNSTFERYKKGEIAAMAGDGCVWKKKKAPTGNLPKLAN